MSGRWEGEWRSTTEKFHGTVKAHVTQCDATHYRCVFTGRAFKILPYRYTAVLTACADPETGRISFSCTQKLPIWGCYWMNGYATQCTFCARYRTDENAGYFVMHRVSGR